MNIIIKDTTIKEETLLSKIQQSKKILMKKMTNLSSVPNSKTASKKALISPTRWHLPAPQAFQNVNFLQC